ncbi:HFL310Wp [Eremothecium sinecaudum]|uniref:Ribose-5-phosphate isomerase n=1 Tax=Eremothecium sinecaudum TaxID=45286 RepID=A0A0X8HU84_9SACH|nr:HFL310Wp [Eremothecium sinecaudum]AMD21546.1 HFL310Wp [Eremothecium sinecaudum]
MTLVGISELPSLGDELENAKRAASYRAVDENLKYFEHKIIGIGSGSTVAYVAERIGQYQAEYADKVEFICIATGFQSRDLIITNKLRLASIEQYPHIDIAFDGADEVDHNLQLIKGGGGCLFQEKLVCTSSQQLIVVADAKKKSPKYLGTCWKKGVPIEVVPGAHVFVQSKLREIEGFEFAELRDGGQSKAGPAITDNNNFIIDAHFGQIQDPIELHSRIKMLVGVVETGLFVNNAEKVYFGTPDGNVEVLSR